MELKMKIKNKLADIAEGLYFINCIYEKDLATALKPVPKANKLAQS
jgi:hypothetical protein